MVYDAMVIGSGIGGMVAASLLAKEGLKVLSALRWREGCKLIKSIEAIFSILMMLESFLAPALNLERVADDCAGVHRLSRPVSARARKVLSNSFAFGGINVSLIWGAVS